MRTVKFGLFPKVHKRLFGIDVKEGTPKSRLVSAAITSVPEVALIMPLEASKVSMGAGGTARGANGARSQPTI